jgi:hypothetical protein
MVNVKSAQAVISSLKGKFSGGDYWQEEGILSLAGRRK